MSRQPEKSNHAVCPVCKVQCKETIYDSILQCSQCGIAFENLSECVINSGRLYSRKYFQGEVYRDYMNEGKFRKKNFRKKLRHIKILPGQGKVLDIGCAAGYFMDIMREEGYEVYGVEVSAYASEYAVKTGKHKVHNGDLISGEFPDNFFDVITMWDVLEHLPNPVEVMSETGRILRENGILVIETLNINSVAVKLMKQNWPLFYPPYHLVYFNADILTELLEKAGFTLIKIMPVQTYFRFCGKYRVLRYFNNFLMKNIFGKFFNDVIMVVAEKK